MQCPVDAFASQNKIVILISHLAQTFNCQFVTLFSFYTCVFESIVNLFLSLDDHPYIPWSFDFDMTLALHPVYSILLLVWRASTLL